MEGGATLRHSVKETMLAYLLIVNNVDVNVDDWICQAAPCEGEDE